MTDQNKCKQEQQGYATQQQQNSLVDCEGPAGEHFRVSQQACNAAQAVEGQASSSQPVNLQLPQSNYQPSQYNVNPPPTFQPLPTFQAQPSINIPNGQYVPKPIKHCYVGPDGITYCY